MLESLLEGEYEQAEVIKLEDQMQFARNKDEKIGKQNLPILQSSNSIDKMQHFIVQDQLIGDCFEYLKQGDIQAIKDQHLMVVHELDQCTNSDRAIILTQQAQVLDQMVKQSDVQKFSHFFHLDDQATNSSSIPSHAQQTIDRARHIAQQNSSKRQPRSTAPIKALPLSKTWGGKLFIKIDGVRKIVSEGMHVFISGTEWVVIGNNIFPLGAGQAIIDKNGNCHLKDLNNQLHCLENDQSVSWPDGTVYIYQDKQLQPIANQATAVIDGKKYVNNNGKLTIFQAEKPEGQFNQAIKETTDLVSTPAHPIPNISKEVDARAQSILNKFNI